MSDALSYLLKVRPDAMKPYFAFMREAGKHLDPKTRNRSRSSPRSMPGPTRDSASTW
jgi:hypothetical protein